MERRNVVMNWRIIQVLVSVFLFGIVFSGAGDLWAASGKTGDVVVICNDSVPAASLSKDDIQEMFMGRKTRWSDGQKVVLATLKDGDANDAFMNEYVGNTPRQFVDYWKKQAFTGRGRMPGSFASPGDLIDFVKKTPGAIGYIPASEYKNQVKSITIE